MLNSTISGNTAATDSGGVYIDSGATADIQFSTIVSNTGGSGLNFSGVVTMTSSVIANHAQDCGSTGLSDSGFNLDSDGSCSLTASTSQSNVDPQLLPLANNGGNGETHMPMLTSPLLNVMAMGDNGCGTVVLVDQRGNARPNQVHCDIGAVEGIGNYRPVAVGETYTVAEDLPTATGR